MTPEACRGSSCHIEDERTCFIRPAAPACVIFFSRRSILRSAIRPAILKFAKRGRHRSSCQCRPGARSPAIVSGASTCIAGRGAGPRHRRARIVGAGAGARVKLPIAIISRNCRASRHGRGVVCQRCSCLLLRQGAGNDIVLRIVSPHESMSVSSRCGGEGGREHGYAGCAGCRDGDGNDNGVASVTAAPYDARMTRRARPLMVAVTEEQVHRGRFADAAGRYSSCQRRRWPISNIAALATRA